MNARNLSLNYIIISILYILYDAWHSILNWLKSRTTISLSYHWFNFVLGLSKQVISSIILF